MTELQKIATELLVIAEDNECRRRQDRCDNIAYSVRFFPQTWPSTALGFDAIGGQAFTKANTYVLTPEFQDGVAYVYFGRWFAYKASTKSQKFQEDLNNESMLPEIMSDQYRTENEE